MNDDLSTKTPAPQQVACTPRRTMGQVLRGLAGTASGWRSSRRGSFLVIVVGTLAILAVMAVIYSTIGTHDARMSSASAKHERLDDVPQQVSDYILQIIGQSTLAPVYQSKMFVAGNAVIPYSRMTSDYPSTPWNMRADITRPSLPATLPFNPTGGVSGFITTPDVSLTPASSMPNSWAPSTPWLASTEPTYLDFVQAGLTDPTRPYLNNRDWLHISNIAPDGRFVNLWNLRGNFGATGIDTNTNQPYMSEHLSLYGANGQPQTGNSLTDFNVAIPDYNIPAYTDSRQQWLFRPARPTPGIAPSDMRYDPSQYADADGDGMYDSRWQELVDNRTAANLLHTDGRYRYFIATRIIDASSLINVNTATDFHTAPVAYLPAGMNAGEIDLQRLFRMRDVYDVNGPLGSGQHGGYDGDFQGADPLAVYGPFGTTPPPETTYPLTGTAAGYDELRAFLVGDDAYTALRLAAASGTIPPAFFRAVAGGGYAPLAGASPASFANQYAVPATGWGFATAPYLGFADPYLRYNYYRGKVQSFEDTLFVGGATPLSFTSSFGIDDLGELLTRRAVNDPNVTSSLESALEGRDDSTLTVFPTSTHFGLLRSNRGLDVEHDQRYAFPIDLTVGRAFDRTMLHFAADIRQRITTHSGARPFRPLTGIDPNQLSSAELRINPLPYLQAIKDADAAIASGTTTPLLLQNKAISLNAIFKAYADALLPTSDLGDPWALGADTRKTEFYGGHGPELALHVAAHMAANFIDMHDKLNVPTVQTLSLSRTTPGFITSHQTDYPTWDTTLPATIPNGFQLPDARLGKIPADDIHTPAINIYGIETQPFLTQVASFTVYADAELPAGDDDAGTPPGNITIKGDLNLTSNHDLMYRVVAFQLTNPFGVDLKLGNLPDEFGYFDINATNYPAIDREANFYYIRFGSKILKLAQLVEATYNDASDPSGGPVYAGSGAAYPPGSVYMQPGNSPPPPPGGVPVAESYIHLRNITIHAGKSVVCYALSDVPRRILSDRFASLSGSTNPADAGSYFNIADTTFGIKGTEIRTRIRNAIEHELGSTNPGVDGVFWIPEVSPGPGTRKGQVQLPHNTDLFAGGPITNVSLWRAMRYGTEAVATAVTPPGTYWDGSPALPMPNTTLPPHNDFTNDQLVDRLHIPSTMNLNHGLPQVQNQIDDTNSVTGGGQVAMPQYLCVITTHASVRRKGDPRPGNTNPPLGAIPGYCLEPKFAADTWNVTEQDNLSPSGHLQWTDFQGTGNNFKGAATSPKGWLTRMGSQHLDYYSENPLTGNKYQMHLPLNASTDTVVANIVPQTTLDPVVGQVAYNTVYPQINIDDNEFTQTVPAPINAPVSTLRLADMLLPLGIGPEEMPYDKAGVAVIDDDLKWTTLSEALALAMGYQTSGPPIPTKPDATIPYYFPPGGTKPLPLDRGNLRLDNYAPFVDLDNSGDFTPGDERMGSGVPLALTILDMFTVSPGGPESLTNPVRGIININTVPTPTLRAGFSMLSPPPIVDRANNPWWWWAPNAGVQPPLDEHSDIAATVTAYRDKAFHYFRPQSQFTTPLPAPNDVIKGADFTDATASGTPIRPDIPGPLDGRALGTGVNGVHEDPGFRSLGELAIARFRLTADPASPAYRCNMDFLGHDTLPANPGITPPAGVTYANGASGRIGLDSVLYNVGGVKVPSAVPNSYAEQLEILNGVLNNVTTRSDYFVVWFMIQGYQKSDVDGLGPSDPMIPSIARRFVMVVDRSNVAKKGDKPNVLYFKELPVDPAPQ